MSYRGKPKQRWFTRKRHGRVQHIPISSGMRKRGLPKIGGDVIRLRVPMRTANSRLPKPKGSIIKTAVYSVLSQVARALPIISELHTAYVLADSIYDNWSIIKELYDSYQKGETDKIATSIGTEVVHGGLSNLQTNILWSQIARLIPTSLQKEGKAILSQLMGKVTTAEINFVKSFLTSQKNQNDKSLHISKSEYTSRNVLRKGPKWPEDVKYV